MYAGLFLLTAALLLSACPGGASENSASVKIQAFAGETAVLPCNISLRNDNPTVEWSKEGLKPNTVFLYRDGCETYEIKNPAFRHRTNLFLEELKNGNISLRISNLQLSDAGTYVCMLVLKTTPQEVARLQLVVVAVSEPKLSVVPAVGGGGVKVQCETYCWKPEPQITFLDEQGSNINAEDPKTSVDPRGCFTTTRRTTVQTASSRITCRAHQPDIKQTRVTDMFLFQDQNTWSFCPFLITAISIICALFAIPCIVLSKIYICDRSQKSPVPNPATQRNQADNDRNALPEYQRKIQDLESKLTEKEEANKQLTSELNALRSKLSPILCQHDQPTFDTSPSKSPPDASQSINLSPKPTDLPPRPFDNRNCSKSGNSSKRDDSKPGAPEPMSSSRLSLPTDNVAVSPRSPSALISNNGLVDRSVSFSKPRPVRSPHRHTVSFNNPFSPLEDLPKNVSQSMNLPPTIDNGNCSKPGNSSKMDDSKPGAPKPMSSSRLSLPTDNNAVSPSSPSALPSKKEDVDRSVSFSKPRPVRSPHRHTISFNNPFSPLEDLPKNVSQSTDLPPTTDNGNCSKPGNSSKGDDSKPESMSASRLSLPTDNDAVSPSSPSALTSKKGDVERSMSLSKPRPVSVRSPRRNTISAPLYNRFSVLGDLSEEAEPLVK